MPVAVSFANCRLKPGQPESYYKYTRGEITKGWHTTITLPRLELYKNDFVLCMIDSFAEAVVVAATFIREFGVMPYLTYYDQIDSVLYLNMCEIINTSDRTINDCIELLDALNSNADIEHINHDRWGQQLIGDNKSVF